MNNVLIYAAKRGNTEIVKSLIAAGAYLETVEIWNKTPLICAAGKGHTEIAKLLIAAGASINPEDSFLMDA